MTLCDILNTNAPVPTNEHERSQEWLQNICLSVRQARVYSSNFSLLFLLNKTPESIVQTLSRKVVIKKCTFTLTFQFIHVLNKNKTNYSITCLRLTILKKTGRCSTELT